MIEQHPQVEGFDPPHSQVLEQSPSEAWHWSGERSDGEIVDGLWEWDFGFDELAEAELFEMWAARDGVEQRCRDDLGPTRPLLPRLVEMHLKAAQVVEQRQDGDLRLRKRTEKGHLQAAHERSDCRVRHELGEEAIRACRAAAPFRRDRAQPDRARDGVDALREKEVTQRRDARPSALEERVQLFKDLFQYLVGKPAIWRHPVLLLVRFVGWRTSDRVRLLSVPAQSDRLLADESARPTYLGAQELLLLPPCRRRSGMLTPDCDSDREP